MNIKILEKQAAKDFVNNDQNFRSILDDVYIIEWLEENNVKMYLFYEDDILKSFVLLTKLEKDPEKIHKNPMYFNYVYTFPEFRRKKIAKLFLEELKRIEEITVFCTDDNSKNLFISAGFNFYKMDPFLKSFPIYRYP
jgi:hypothetical protein